MYLLEQLSQAEPAPQNFQELIGTVAIHPSAFVLATHGRAIPVLSKDEFDEIPVDSAFTKPFQLNMTDQATYGNVANPGVTMFFPENRMLVEPPNPRIVGDSARPSDAVRYTPQANQVKGPDNFRSADFLLRKVYDEDKITEEILNAWLHAEHGPVAYHKAVKEAYIAQLEASDGPVVLVDVHDTSEWGIEEADELRATTIVRRTEAGQTVGFPLAIISDLDGEASGNSGYAELFKDKLKEAYSNEGVEADEEDGPEAKKDGLWGKLECNSRFKGGYITKLLGVELRNELIEAGRQDLADKIIVFQVELNRSNLLDDVTQEIDSASAYIEATILAEAINGFTEVVVKSWKEKNK